MARVIPTTTSTTITTAFLHLTSSSTHHHHHRLCFSSLKKSPTRPHLSLHNAMSNTTTTTDSSTLETIGDSLLLTTFKTLARPYKPYPLIGWNRHLETIFAAFFRSLPGVRFRRECLRTLDNGSVALDWVSGDDREIPADSPVLILLPGLTGGSNDTYVQHMLVRARRNRWRVVVFNSRGCGGSPVTTAQFYSASFTEDMREVVKHVKARYPTSNLYAVGWSLGANILVRYLGQESHGCLLSGAVSLCNPFNLVIADEDFRKGFNNIYDKALARSLTKIFKKHALLFEDIGGEYDIPLAANAKTVKDFDKGLTRVSFGFNSVEDYYSKSSSSDSIKHVRTPLLCIQAANDPIAPSRGIPREDIKENSNCLLIVTPRGGHLGWVAGEDAPFGAPWTDPLVMEFLLHLEKEKSSSKPDSLQDRSSGDREVDMKPASDEPVMVILTVGIVFKLHYADECRGAYVNDTSEHVTGLIFVTNSDNEQMSVLTPDISR